MAVVQKDYKSELNQCLQKHCRRPIQKNVDIVYTVNKFGNQCQAVVKLNCLDGQEYAGHLCADSKSAEKSAAEQAMEANKVTFAQLLNTPKQPKALAAGMGQGATAVPMTPGVMKRPLPLNAAVVQPTVKKPKVAAENLPHKTELNAFCLKILKRSMNKGEVLYNTTQIGEQHQATVQIPFLPDDWAKRAWAGQLCATKQAAEQSAAEEALKDLQASPEIMEKVGATKKKIPPRKKMLQMMEEMMASLTEEDDGENSLMKRAMEWMTNGRQGPPPRDPVELTPVSGTVSEWKGSWGWIKPDIAIEHEAAEFHEGKVYVNKRDLAEGLEELAEGLSVKFKVYVDPNGLGAEECSIA